jgi:photosystem II stability/assembly factor-like uncharacterized protein
VTEPEDPFDTWLQGQVEPLRPPPGTFEQIRKRARRRKTRRAMMSAATAGAAAALVVVAVVAVPRLVPSLHGTPRAAANSKLANPKYSGSAQTVTASPPTRLTPSASTPADGTEPARVPADLAPTSITFVNFNDGWVIGQAAGCGQGYCTTMAKTTNYGQSWTPVPAPRTGAPDSSTGVSQVRFLDPENGWAFGPQLYETHNGGQSWVPINTYGMRVTDLETVGGMAYAVFAQCTGTGSDFAADCQNVSVYSSPVDSNTWTLMSTLNGLGFNGGNVSGKIVLNGAVNGGEGYFYAPDGLLYSGAATEGTTWQMAADQALPCQPSSAQSDGQPSGGQLAAWGSGDLALACPAGAGGTAAGGTQEQVSTSSDGGQSWQPQGTLTVKGSATSLTATTTGTLALATTGGIYRSADGGQSWQQTEEGPPGGFSYVGMTNAVKGVAVPAEPAQSNSVWYTSNAGASWTQSSLSNP